MPLFAHLRRLSDGSFRREADPLKIVSRTAFRTAIGLRTHHSSIHGSRANVIFRRCSSQTIGTAPRADAARDADYHERTEGEAIAIINGLHVRLLFYTREGPFHSGAIRSLIQPTCHSIEITLMKVKVLQVIRNRLKLKSAEK
jgi:hypothetical protein